MDAIEAARQEAARLHNLAVEAGDNNCSLLDFVLLEAGRRGIEVYAVLEGDPQLKGGRAVFDSQAGIIVYEDIGSDFDKAFLIAHEIGHVVLEDRNEDSVTDNIESDRSAEAPAVGAEKVVDYGCHERREITMDLFARELLLPRAVAKQWHIEENLSSKDIASRINAPLYVVQQQLIDALLLPEIPKKEIEANTLTGLDEFQHKAAHHRGTPFQLQAGPGTGKTRTLVHRIETLLQEGVNPDSILVLTFSNKAAGELRDRIAAKFPEAVATLWLGTFHSFGLDVVHRFHDRMELSENPKVVSRYEAIELLEDELARLPLKHFRNLYDPTLDLADMLSAISRAKDEVVDSERYIALAQDMLDNAADEQQQIQAEKCLDVGHLYEVYERKLKENDSVDFGDLVSLPVRLVENDDQVRSLLSERHQHILVDEYQDVNRGSVRLIKAISGKGNNLWVVGDSRQSIYRFRGASSINMKRFSEDFPGAEVADLEVNYRSVSEVVDLYRQFSLDMKASGGVLPLQLTSYRDKSNEMPEFRIAETPDDEVTVIAAAVKEKNEQGFDYKNQAVLCGSHKRLGEIAAGFEQLGLPVLYLGSLFEREEIKDLLSLLSLVTDRYAVGLVRAATIPDFVLRLEQITLLLEHIRGAELESLGWGELGDDVPGLADQTCDTLKRLSAILNGFPINGNPWSILTTLIIDRLGWAKQVSLADTDNLEAKMKGIALWQLLNFVHTPNSGKGLPIDRLLSRIRRIVLLSEDREMRQLPQAAQSIDGVRLMTIHASKGLEFKVVHIPGMIATGLPASNRPPRCVPPDGLIDGSQGLTGLEAIKAGHVEEEECKFFVGASRAEDRLLLYASSVQNNGSNRNPSKYIGRISPYMRQDDNPPRLDTEPELVEEFSIKDETLQLTDKQISLYNRCPRRFFYIHALSLTVKRTDSAFMKMHNAVYDVLDWFRQHHSESTPTKAELITQFDQSWANKGPVDHGYTDDYHRIGQRLVEFLMETRQGLQLQKPELLQLLLPDGEINVLPDEVAIGQDGSRSIRRIKTGKMASDEFDHIEYSILMEAAEQYFGHGTRVEAVHLAGETQEQVCITDRKKMTRLAKTKATLSDIAGGRFPAKPDNRSCPRCPCFFICGKVPAGHVKINN